MKPILSAALFAAGLFLASLSAAEREVEFRCVVGGPNATAAIQAAGGPRLYHLHDAAGTRKLGSVALRTKFGVAPWVERFVVPDGPLLLSMDPEPASARNPEQLIGSFEVPSDAKSLVVLIVPRGPKLVDSYTIAFDESARSFPPGSIKLVNLSPESIRWTTDPYKKLELAPKTAGTMILPPPRNGAASVALRCEVRRKDGWWIGYAGSRDVAPNRRDILTVFVRPGANNLEVVGIQE